MTVDTTEKQKIFKNWNNIRKCNTNLEFNVSYFKVVFNFLFIKKYSSTS